MEVKVLAWYVYKKCKTAGYDGGSQGTGLVRVQKM